MSSFFKKSGTKKGVPLSSLQWAQSTTPVSDRKISTQKPQPSDLKDLPVGKFRTDLRAFLQDLNDQDRDLWVTILLHANKERSRAKPSDKWLTDGAAYVHELGEASFVRKCMGWMQMHIPDPAVSDPSSEVLRSLICLCACSQSDALVMALGNLAIAAFRKVKGYGPRSAKFGNACIWTLCEMAQNGNDTAVAEITRIHARTIYDSVRKTTDLALNDIAYDRKTTQADLEEACLPTFDLDDNGQLIKTIDGYTATLTLQNAQAVVTWNNPAGKTLKSAPAALKAAHLYEVAEVAQLKKNLTAVCAAQVARLEATFLSGTTWDFDEWMQRFIGHPIRKSLAENLVWTVQTSQTHATFTPRGADLHHANGEKLAALPPDAQVTLWHPANATEDELTAWRGRFMLKPQPLKQAHREVYALIATERDGATYTNRFAAHILRHYQFSALCNDRGWQYKKHGLRDTDPSSAKRAISDSGITAEFMLTPILSDEDKKSFRDPSHAKTNRVLFALGDGTQVALCDIPTVIMSEVLRDIDMFISVTSVADDPNWTDLVQ
jgi:hypothetical protein